MIFGTAGALAAGGGATPDRPRAVPGAGRLSRRLNAVISATANTTAAIAVTMMTAQRRGGGEVTVIFSFGADLVLKEFAELDERVEQGLRDLILIGRCGSWVS